MDISDLKIKELFALRNLFKEVNHDPSPFQGEYKEVSDDLSPFQGKYSVIRSYDSGVHSGYVEKYDPTTRHVFLKQARRFWDWRAFTLSELANKGNNPGSKVSMEIPNIMVANVIEIIPCSEKGKENLMNYPVHEC